VELRMSDSSPDDLTFEESFEELDQIVRDLEDGNLGLEESLSRYERGVGLLKRCHARLRQAEQRIQLLTGVDAEEKPILQPFEHAATADAGKAAPRRVVRKKPDDPEIPF
jgi:exodeoxyribonuclease VII small subunit